MGTKAAIVAGGKGTRIRSMTGNRIPKALVPVAGTPIVFRQMDLLVRSGVTDVAVIAGHLAEQLRLAMTPHAAALGLGLRFFVEREARGTAGGLLAAREYLSGDEFLVLYGDIAVEMDLARLVSFHRAAAAVATIVAHPNDHPHESDLLATDGEGHVTAVLPRATRGPGHYRNLVPAGVYCVSPGIFHYLEPDVKQDFIRDVFPRMLQDGATVCAYNTPEYLRDMGTPGRYAMVERDIETSLCERLHFGHRRPAVFFDRDGVLNRDGGNSGLTSAGELELLPGAAEAVRLVNDRGQLAVLVTNQPGVAKGFMAAAALEEIHARLETLLGHGGAKLDRIYCCPHHPEGGFAGEVNGLKVECECRKPRPGMLLRAAEELPIQLDESCVIGDSARDVGAARAAGVWVYGVRTGAGCRDCIPRCQPDLLFDDVLEAARFAVSCTDQGEVVAARACEGLRRGRVPRVVGVCGLARCGKSSLAHAVVRALRRRGVSALHLRLDGWILPEPRRRPGSVAEERVQARLYPELLDRLLRGEVVTAPCEATAGGVGPVAEYCAAGCQVVVVDGLLACHQGVRDMLDLGVYLEVDTDTLIERFRAHYGWKGVDKAGVEPLLRERMAEEWPAVEAQRDGADLVLAAEGSEGAA